MPTTTPKNHYLVLPIVKSHSDEDTNTALVPLTRDYVAALLRYMDVAADLRADPRLNATFDALVLFDGAPAWLHFLEGDDEADAAFAGVREEALDAGEGRLVAEATIPPELHPSAPRSAQVKWTGGDRLKVWPGEVCWLATLGDEVHLETLNVTKPFLEDLLTCWDEV